MRRWFLLFVGLSVGLSNSVRTEAIEFRDGDRVVLIGSTLIERAQRYGYLESELTAALAAQGKRVTFRNLGWSGDTVWAESRGIFDPPAEGYKRMIAQVRELKPTLILLNYGANEAFAGEPGLKPFITQYEQLLNDLQADGVRFVLISPIDHLPFSELHPDPREYNEKLTVYRDAIRELATRRDMPFVDLSDDLGAKAPLGTAESPVSLPAHEMSDTGIHLNAYGYKLLAPVFRDALLGSNQPKTLKVSANGNSPATELMPSVTFSGSDIGLTVKLPRVQIPGELVPSYQLRVSGLKPGRYSLAENDETLLTLTDKQLAEGIPLYLLDLERYEQLRETIVDKNMLYFHRWRPQNVTYLFLFRKHEQGNNAKEIPEFDPLIEQHEQRIFELSQPVAHQLTLRPAPADTAE